MTLRSKGILTAEGLEDVLALTDDAIRDTRAAGSKAEVSANAATEAARSFSVNVLEASRTAADRTAATLTATVDAALANVVGGTAIKGAVGTAAQLPAGEPEGSAYVVRDTGTVWEYRSGQWVNTGNGTVTVKAQVAATQAGPLRRLASRGGTIRVDCIGDSLTHGQYENQPDSRPPAQKPDGNTPGQYRAPQTWPDGLNEALSFAYPDSTIILRDMSWPGDRTTEALERWKNVDHSQTDIAIIMLGTNDQGNYAGYPDGPNSMEVYQANIGALIERYRSVGAAIVLIGPPLITDPVPSGRTRAHAESLRMLAQRYGAVYLDATELLKGVPATDPLYVDTLHLSKQAYALFGWRVVSIFGPYGSQPPRVGHGSRFYPRDNVWAGKFSTINTDLQQIVGAERIRIPAGGVCMIPFDATAPVIPRFQFAAQGGDGNLECIYYGNKTSINPIVINSKNGVTVEGNGHRHEAGRGTLILRAADAAIDLESVTFNQPVTLLLPARGLADYVSTGFSTLVGRGVQKVGTNDWSFLGDTQPEFTLKEGKTLRAVLTLAKEGEQGMIIVNGEFQGYYGLGNGYWIKRALDTGLEVRRFDANGTATLTVVDGVFPAGSWTGTITLRFTGTGIAVLVNEVEKYKITDPAWPTFQPGLLAGISENSYAACHALTIG